MLHTINLYNRDCDFSGLEATYDGVNVVFGECTVTKGGVSQSLEDIGFRLEGDTEKRIQYKLYLLKDYNGVFTHHLVRIEIDPDGRDIPHEPDNVVFLLSEIYVEKDGTVAGVIYNSTDEMPYTTNADLMKLPRQFNIRIDESIFAAEESPKERVRDVQNPRT
ncbi:hypothetical protein ACINLE_17445 [Bacillus sp. z60-18]|uniref:hypothetical protein n=1 Tax=unclassified Bacillus (in: firmicutes) TaxID=185979 RepID=UPI00390C5A84